MAEGRRMNVKRNADMRRLLLFQQLQVDVHKPRKRVCEHSFFVGKQTYSVERAVHYAVSVYQQ